MTIFRLLRFSAALISSLLFWSCVSIHVGPPASQKSRDVLYQAPKKPFAELNSEAVDRAWRNEGNGNTISFLSDCNNSADPTLENIYKGITAEIDDVHPVETAHVNYNSREALHSIVEGKVDGLATRIELMIFKKNNCTYIITYTGVATAFAANQIEFFQFVKGFKIP